MKTNYFWDDKYVPLAIFNSETARGLIHTEEWKLQMKKLQAEYDAALREFALNRNWHIVE